MATLTLEQALTLARDAAGRGGWPEASRIAAAILAAVPDHAEAAALQCRAFAELQQPDSAAIACRRAVETASRYRRENSAAEVLQRLAARGFAPRGLLDIGAYEGEWAELALQVFPSGRILMIEAQPRLRPRLTALANARSDRLASEIALLGREDREAVTFFQMDTPFGSTGSSIYDEQTDFARTPLALPMRRLDGVASRHPWAPFELMKIDVQGAELEVLAGAGEVLREVQAVFMEISFAEYNRGAPLFVETVAAMDRYGFWLTDLADLRRGRAGALLQADALFLRRGSPYLPQPPFA